MKLNYVRKVWKIWNHAIYDAITKLDMRLWASVLVILIAVIGTQDSFAEEFSIERISHIEIGFFGQIDPDLKDPIISIFRGVIGSIVAGIVAGLFVKFLTKTKAEKTFQENSKMAYRYMFQHISELDNNKKVIYDMWESNGRNKDSNTTMVFDPYYYKEIQRFRGRILNDIKNLTLYKNSPYVILSEYLLLIKYAWSAYEHMYSFDDKRNEIDRDEKMLESHRYYAKEIINTFTYPIPKDFIDKWKVEFEKIGGPEFVTMPSLEPGDIPANHYNFGNEILYFDAQYSSVLELLREIRDLLQNNHSAAKRNVFTKRSE